MRNKFDEQLKELNYQMIDMGKMIVDSIAKAIDALINSDKDLAKKIIENDNEIDHQQKMIENQCFNLLIQQQPVARDLRNITAAMKMVTDMERIGDHAADICEMAIEMGSANEASNFKYIKTMASEIMLMLNKSIEAYVEKDIQKAKDVIEYDDKIDSLFNQGKAEIIQKILNHPENGEDLSDLLMVTKYFERIGDHATNISEWVIYSISGQ